VLGTHIQEVMDAIWSHTTGQAALKGGYCEEYVALLKEFFSTCYFSTENYKPSYDPAIHGYEYENSRASQFDKPTSGRHSLLKCFEKNPGDVARIFIDIFCQTYHEKTSREIIRFKIRAMEIGLYAKADLEGIQPASPSQLLPKVLTEVVYSVCAEFPEVAATITLSLRQLIKSSILHDYFCLVTQADLNRVVPILVAVALDEDQNIAPAPLAVHIGENLAAGKTLEAIFKGLLDDRTSTKDYDALHVQERVQKRQEFFKGRKDRGKDIKGQLESEQCPTLNGKLRFSQAVKDYISLLLQGMELNPMERRLAAIGFEGEIPEEFVCPISLSIMSHPSFFGGLENRQCFDKSTIEGWLKLGNTSHPTTREDVKGKLLIEDLELAAKIEEFVAQQEKLAQQAPSGEQQGFGWKQRVGIFSSVTGAGSRVNPPAKGSSGGGGGGGPANEAEDDDHPLKPGSGGGGAGK
jgi:hypothetical protein